MSGKFELPVWAAEAPRLTAAVLEVQKDGERVETIKVGSRVSVTFGRNEATADIALAHQSISRLHAAVVHDTLGNLQVLDCGSTHGTFVCGKRIEQHVPVILKEGDVITFGGSKVCAMTTWRPVCSATL